MVDYVNNVVDRLLNRIPGGLKGRDARGGEAATLEATPGDASTGGREAAEARSEPRAARDYVPRAVRASFARAQKPRASRVFDTYDSVLATQLSVG